MAGDEDPIVLVRLWRLAIPALGWVMDGVLTAGQQVGRVGS